MNEYSIIFNLLTQRITEDDLEIIGIKEKRLLDTLKFTGKNATIRLQSILSEFSKNISVFDLQIKKNPFNDHWYLSQASDVQEFMLNNPFNNKPKLAATLCTIIALSLAQNGTVSKKNIEEIRKKKNIDQDLKELKDLNLIIIKENRVHIHPNLGYYMDIEKFIEFIERKSRILRYDN